MFCPICGNKLNTQICSSCGYDGSSDLEAFPTLGKKAGVAPRSTAIRAYTASFNEKYTMLEKNFIELKKQTKQLADAIEVMNKSLKAAEEKIEALSSRSEQPDKSSAAAESMVHNLSRLKPSALKRGDTVIAGKYQQDEIEWIVLSIKDDTAVLISKYVLDFRQFFATREYKGLNLWTDSSLGEWLNNEFFNNVFSKAELKRIATANLPHKSSAYSKLFLLSLTEYKKYFGDDISAKCAPTEFAKKEGAFASANGGGTRWWLRSAGRNGGYAMFVDYNGAAMEAGAPITERKGIRPAMLIKV